MKVSQKLLSISLGIILFISLSIYFFSEYQTGIIEKANKRSRIVLEMSLKNKEINIAINNFQINDIYSEDYYELGISDNLENYTNLMNELLILEDKYFQVYKESDSEQIKSLFLSFLTNLKNSIDKLVDAYSILGFNDYGMEAEFALGRDKMEENFIPEDEIIFNMSLEYLKVQEMKFIHRKDEKYIEKAASALEDALVVIGEKNQFRTISEEYTNSMVAYKKQYTLIGLSPNEGLRGELQNNLVELEQFFRKLSEDSDLAMTRASRNKTVFGLLFIISGILISSIIFILLSRHVTVPLNKLSITASQIADGDLTSKISSSMMNRRDEIGLLAQALNGTVENLKKTVQKIQQSTSENKKVGETLSESAEMTSQSVEAVNGKLTNFTELFTTLDRNIARSRLASEQIFQNTSNLGVRISGQVSAVEETSAIIEEMSASLNSIAGITAEKNKISEDLVQITREGDERVKETNIIIQEISESTGQMKDLTDLINGIASQTNLLSMNAAIEAAHAGDAGKGFGVVSEEIRKLSEGTTEAVKGISAYLKSVITRIEGALSASEKSGKAFTRVNKGVVDSADAFKSISTMVSEVSSGSKDMLNAVSQINEVTKDVHSGAEEIMGIIQSLGKDMKEVESLSSQGAIEINESLKSIEAIDNYTDRVAELSNSNEHIIEHLTELVTSFKLPV